MKPTMPMNAFPPGGPPGAPPPGGGQPPPGGGWGGPPSGPGGMPPPMGFPPAFPSKKNKASLYVGLGCGCLALLACVITVPIVAMSGGLAAVGLLGPGDEVASIPITLNQPFSLSYLQSGSQKYAAWLEVNVAYGHEYNLNGNILLSENNQPFGQYTLAEDGDGPAVQERNSVTRVGWTRSSLNGSGNASGTVSLFPVPARTAGSTVTLSGTIQAAPGTTGTVRLFVAERN